MRFIVSGFCAHDGVLSFEVFAGFLRPAPAILLQRAYTGKETSNREPLPTRSLNRDRSFVPVQDALHHRHPQTDAL
jgi:hypothetical protein